MSLKFFSYLLYISFITVSAQNFYVEIAPWQGAKPGAVSISFDDASFTQYEYAYPILKKYDLPATFSLVGEWTRQKASNSAEPGMFQIKKMGWKQIRKLSDEQYEIAAHGYRHVRYGKYLPVDTLINQMKRIKLLIENQINQPVYTLHYPYSFTSDSIVKATRKSGFIFGRTGGNDYNSYQNFNPYLLKTKAVLNDTLPNIDSFKKILKLTKGKWLILMYHHLFPETSKEMKIMNYHNVLHTYSLYPKTFDRQMKLVKESGYHIDTEANIGRYMIERIHTKLSYKKICKTLIIKTKTDLDKKVYKVPLSLIVKLPWQKVKLKGSLHDGTFEVQKGQILIDILPGNTVKIKKMK